MYHLHAIVTIYLALGAQALTYFVSSECARKGFDETVMDEVRAMGREGSTRLQDNTNDRMAHNFQEIFKVNRDDPTVRERALSKLLRLLNYKPHRKLLTINSGL